MRRRVFLGLVCFAGVAIALLLWRDGAHTRTSPDGSRLVLSDVRIGQTNVYLHGTLLSKSIGRFAPSNGWSIGDITVARPTQVPVHGWSGTEILSAQLKVYPASGRGDDFLKPPFYRKFRLLLIGDDGFSFVQEFYQPYEFKRYSDGIYGYVHARKWPRTSREIRIRLEERLTESRRDFRELATFTVTNPRLVEPESWTASKSFHTNLLGNIHMEVGEIVVRSEPPNPRDIWEHTAELPVRFKSNGQMLTNWGIHYGPMQDATGNPELFTFGSTLVLTNDWSVYRIFRELNPMHPWRFEVNVALTADFPETNLFTFDAPSTRRPTFSTNFAGVPVTIGYIRDHTFQVELPSRPPDLRLTLIEARDDQGNHLTAGSWGQHRFSTQFALRVGQREWNVRATIAIHPNYPVEFTLQPRYESRNRTLPVTQN